MSDPLGIDATLRNVESWIYQRHDLPPDHGQWYVPITNWGPFPPLSQMVADARGIYDFAVMHIPDAGLLNDMAGTQASIRDEADKHASELQSSLDALSASWQGPAAEAYYAPPGFHADQVTPSGTAYTLLQNLQTVGTGTDHNTQSHATLAGRFDDIGGKQTTVRVSLGAAVVGLGALVAFPPDFELSDKQDARRYYAALSGERMGDTDPRALRDRAAQHLLRALTIYQAGGNERAHSSYRWMWTV